MEEDRLLSNVDLEYYFEKLKIPLHKIKFVTQLNETKPKLGNYIINLDKSETKGTHWCCFVLYPQKLVYYDSFGILNDIPNEVMRFGKKFNKNIKFVFNYDVIQPINSVYCGWYVLYFLWFFNKNKKCENKQLVLNQQNKKFNKNINENDEKLSSLVKDIFRNI